MFIEEDINYIYNYIKYYYLGVEDFDNNNYLIDISRRIRNSMPSSSFVNRKYDFYINNYVCQELRCRKSNSFSRYIEIKNYIYLLINYYKTYKNVQIEDYNTKLYELTRIIFNNYNYEDIISGKCDNDIEYMLENEECNFNPSYINATIPLNISYISIDNGVVIDQKKSIENYVYKILLRDNLKIFTFSGDLKYLASLISNDLFALGISCDSVLKGYCDNMIDSYIRKNMYGINQTNSFKEICIMVSNFVIFNETYMELENEGEKIAEEIFKLSRYVITLGYKKDDIEYHKCDEIMESHLRYDCMLVNSLSLKPNDKIPLNLKSTYISDKQKEVILSTSNNILVSNRENNKEYKHISTTYNESAWNTV